MMVDSIAQMRRTFTVVVPSLNSAMIDQTLASLLAQDCPDLDFNIIVVGRDDLRLIPDHDSITFFDTDQPVSPAAARNLAVQHSKSEFLAFTDADCIADPGWLNALARVLTSDLERIVGGSVHFQKREYWTYVDNLSTFHDLLPHLPAGERHQLPSLNLAMPRTAFDKAQGYDERFPHPAGEDSDLTFRLRQIGYKLLFVPEAVVHHHPPRNSFRQLLQHAYLRGKYSLLVDPRYIGKIGLPKILRNPLVLLLFSPAMAAFATLRMYFTKPRMGRFIPSLLFVYLSKLSWCFGAYVRLHGLDPIAAHEEVDADPSFMGSRTGPS